MFPLTKVVLLFGFIYCPAIYELTQRFFCEIRNYVLTGPCFPLGCYPRKFGGEIFLNVVDCRSSCISFFKHFQKCQDGIDVWDLGPKPKEPWRASKEMNSLREGLNL